MEYNKIYEICQPVIDWLKDNYPHGHKILISTSGAELIETGKITILDQKLMNTIEKGMKDEETQNVVKAFEDFLGNMSRE